MKCCFFLLLIVAFCNAKGSQSSWKSFKAKYHKRYPSAKEEIKRSTIHHLNELLIKNHNKKYDEGLVGFRMEMNEFGDLTQKEFLDQMTGLNGTKFQQSKNMPYTEKRLTNPSSVDWRDLGAVSNVKNQGKCSSSWAFSAAGALEGQYYQKNGRLVSLSAQQLIDCSKPFGNKGCQGGLMNNALNYIKNQNGMQLDSAYPYRGKNQPCNVDNVAQVNTRVKEIVTLPQEQESMLENAVAFVGPVSAAIDAGQPSFQFYSSGVYSDRNCNPRNLNHGVLVVGYGQENGQQYYLIKNSYGTGWGEKGYLKLARNRNNMCGIASLVSYPEI